MRRLDPKSPEDNHICITCSGIHNVCSGECGAKILVPQATMISNVSASRFRPPSCRLMQSSTDRIAHGPNARGAGLFFSKQLGRSQSRPQVGRLDSRERSSASGQLYA